MTVPSRARRHAANVEVRRLETVDDLKYAWAWVRARGLRAEFYGVDGLRVTDGHGAFVARLGQVLTYDPTTGEFAVLDAAVYDKTHTAALPEADCWCGTCESVVLNARAANGDPMAMFARRFIVCAACGNKRCPRAWHHDNACTGSNEPGQVATRNGVRP